MNMVSGWFPAAWTSLCISFAGTWRQYRSRFLSGMLGVLVPMGVTAHPHAWIDLEVEFIADETSRIVAMHQVWKIDPTYSRYLYEDAMEHFEGETPSEKLLNLGLEILENLHEYRWFTEISASGSSLKAEADPTVVMEMTDQRIRFGFHLDFERSIDVSSEKIEYAIFDPSFFIEMLHDRNAEPRIKNLDANCHFTIIQPRPDPRMVAKALAIDFSGNAEPDLGRHFAERVQLQCVSDAIQ